MQVHEDRTVEVARPGGSIDQAAQSLGGVRSDRADADLVTLAAQPHLIGCGQPDVPASPPHSREYLGSANGAS
jgi:hypothetical protein